MTYALATVKGVYTNPIGMVPCVGQVVWFPSSPIVDTANHVTLAIPNDQVALDVNGQFSVQVLPTDTANVSSFAWAFRPAISGVPGAIQYLLVPLAGMPGGGWFIDQLSSAPGY